MVQCRGLEGVGIEYGLQVEPIGITSESKVECERKR